MVAFALQRFIQPIDARLMGNSWIRERIFRRRLCRVDTALAVYIIEFFCLDVIRSRGKSREETMKTVSIEEQIASVSAKCSEIDARRKEVERQAEHVFC